MTSSKPYTLWTEQGFRHEDSLEEVLSEAYAAYTGDYINSVDCIECPDGTTIDGSSQVWLDYVKKCREELREAIERVHRRDPAVGWVEVQSPTGEWHREGVYGDAARVESVAEEYRALYGSDRVRAEVIGA